MYLSSVLSMERKCILWRWRKSAFGKAQNTDTSTVVQCCRVMPFITVQLSLATDTYCQERGHLKKENEYVCDMNSAGKLLRPVPLSKLIQYSQTQKAVEPHSPGLGCLPFLRENIFESQTSSYYCFCIVCAVDQMSDQEPAVKYNWSELVVFRRQF